MSTNPMNDLRVAAQNLGASGKTISNAMFYEALGAAADNQPERDRIRKRISSLVRTGELVRVSPGQFTYNSKATPSRSGEFITRMWRAIKSSTATFSVQDVARISGASMSHASKYMQFLLGGGFIKQQGQKGNSKHYRSTAKTRATIPAPMPPRPLKDPFEEERKYVHELVGLFMVNDPYQPSIQRRICAACQGIINRFDNQNEKGGE